LTRAGKRLKLLEVDTLLKAILPELRGVKTQITID
jgi:hypothetical protein